MAHRGAGAIVYAEDTGNILLLRRSQDVKRPGLWNLPGGHVDAGETPVEAAHRELIEEAGIEVEGHDEILTDGRYCAVVMVVPEEVVPTLNWESDDYEWVDPDEVVEAEDDEGLYPGLAELLSQW